MTRRRLRPAWTPQELAIIYAAPHDHTQWPDHVLRVEATIDLARRLEAKHGPYASAADLSCGDGAVLTALAPDRVYLGDFAPGYEYTGPIEDTIGDIPDVDLFVLTETLEHLDDPDTVLKAIRAKARRLVLSTPVDNWVDDNLEHYWAWSADDVEAMLGAAGFTVDDCVLLDFRRHGPQFYCFGIWGCR